MNTGQINLIAGGIVVRYPGPEQSDDGPDFQNFCTIHRWASYPMPRAVPERRCPFCQVQIGEAKGRERYAELETAMLAQQVCSFVTTRTK